MTIMRDSTSSAFLYIGIALFIDDSRIVQTYAQAKARVD